MMGGMTRECSFDGCDKPLSHWGLCAGHAAHIARGQSLRPLRKRRGRMTPYERVMDQVEWQGECLIFIGKSIVDGGYGSVFYNGHRVGAHRIVMEYYYGPSTEWVLHSCDKPPCVRIEHLRYGDHLENMTDARERDRFDNRLRDEKGRFIAYPATTAEDS